VNALENLMLSVFSVFIPTFWRFRVECTKKIKLISELTFLLLIVNIQSTTHIDVKITKIDD